MPIGSSGRLVPRHATGGEVDLVTVDKQMLQLLREERLKVDHLITDIVRPDPSQIARAYNSLLTEKDKAMAILIDWS